MSAPHVAILILNWNGWADTQACLESLLKLDYPSFRIIVCDNGSTDGSLEHLQAWADGRESAPDVPPLLRPLVHPGTGRPIPWSIAGGGGRSTAGLTFLDNRGNLGFAGGNNRGLAWIRDHTECAYVWLLNNDTLAAPKALTRLVERMQADGRTGVCGSTLLHVAQPDRVQALGGGTLNRWLVTPRPIKGNAAFLPPREAEQKSVEDSMDYVAGASMLVSRAWLETVGLMDERFFLYFEEIDWALRGRGRFSLGYAPGSLVYHREGASIGGNSLDPDTKSPQADQHYIASRFLLCRKHFPSSLPLVMLSLAATLGNRVRRGQWDRIPLVLRSAAAALRSCRPGDGGRA